MGFTRLAISVSANAGMGVGVGVGVGGGMGVGVGCDVDCKDRPNKRNAVLYAAEGGHLECVQVLARHGADMESRDRHHETVLHKAARAGRTDLVRWLCEWRGGTGYVIHHTL